MRDRSSSQQLFHLILHIIKGLPTSVDAIHMFAGDHFATGWLVEHYKGIRDWSLYTLYQILGIHETLFINSSRFHASLENHWNHAIFRPLVFPLQCSVPIPFWEHSEHPPNKETSNRLFHFMAVSFPNFAHSGNRTAEEHWIQSFNKRFQHMSACCVAFSFSTGHLQNRKFWMQPR